MNPPPKKQNTADIPLNVLLVQPPIQEFYLTCKRTIPYGLASICANLEANGYPTQILDGLATNKSKSIAYPKGFAYLSPFYGQEDITLFSLFHHFKHFGYSYEHIGTRVRDLKPFIVGISSLFTAYCDQALETARTIKKFYPQAYTVMGGHHPTHFPESVLDCDAVDFVLRGEGEASLSLLCDALKNKTPLDKVPGIGFRDKGKITLHSPVWIKDLNQLPLPALDRINQSYYQRNKQAAITMVSSRGCPMPCSYCSVSSTSCHGKFRQRDVTDVLREIKEQASRLDIGFIDFEDENLALEKKWILALLSGINKIFKGTPIFKRNRPELRAMNGLYPPSLDREIMTAMQGAGFKTINLSLGSFSRDQLIRFKRPDVRRSHDRALDLAQKLGLTCVSYVIAAAPGQSAASSLEDLLCLAQRRTLVGFSIFYPAPGSLDYALCREKNLLPNRFSLMRSTALPIEDTTTRLEAVTLLRLARILNFLKTRIDTHGNLPNGKVWAGEVLDGNRDTISHKLVQYFLQDGIIRGVDKKGHLYAHTTDADLCQKFIKRIKLLPLMGVERGPLTFPDIEKPDL